MSRRQTLGVLSPSALNSRTNQQAGRILSGKDGSSQASQTAVGGASVPPKARKSLAPTAMAWGGADNRPNAAAGGVDLRRSSAFGGKPSGPKQDPRPLGDKNYLNNCVHTLIAYLSMHGYPAAVSPKTLASPTAKDFTMVVQFLFQRFDPNMKTFGKIEDEVPMFFKRLNYPFQISKSALFAVGSPHSWPAVLAALTWLVELLNYNEKVEEASNPSSERHTEGREEDRPAKIILMSLSLRSVGLSVSPRCRHPRHRGGRKQKGVLRVHRHLLQVRLMMPLLATATRSRSPASSLRNLLLTQALPGRGRRALRGGRGGDAVQLPAQGAEPHGAAGQDPGGVRCEV